MEKELEAFATCMAFENGVDIDFCRSLIRYMEVEGVLDYEVLRETYAEPAVDADNVPVKLHLVK